MIEGPTSPFLEPLVGLQCTLVSGPIKKVRYHIIELTRQNNGRESRLKNGGKLLEIH